MYVILFLSFGQFIRETRSRSAADNAADFPKCRRAHFAARAIFGASVEIIARRRAGRNADFRRIAGFRRTSRQSGLRRTAAGRGEKLDQTSADYRLGKTRPRLSGESGETGD